VIRSILAVIGGFAVGSAVNMGLVTLGSYLVPAPPGVDTTSVESITQSIHLYEFEHFIFPFLAHALGTLAGGLTAGFIAVKHRTQVVVIVAALFFAGGVAVTLMIPAPISYTVVDLVFAYFPMALLALWILGRFSNRKLAAIR